MTHRVYVLPHNDLLNLAFYHRETINRKLKEGVDEALALDCMSCIIALSFSVEALINFIGRKCVDAWDERSPFFEKIKKVLMKLGLSFDVSIEPYATIEILKKIRDQIAHAKPIDIAVHMPSRADLKDAMKAPWDKYLIPDFCKNAYTQVQSFEQLLITRSGIPIEETVTTAAR